MANNHSYSFKLLKIKSEFYCKKNNVGTLFFLQFLLYFGGELNLNEGKRFEQNFAKSIPPDVYYMRIKDTSSSFSHSNKSRFTQENPFDFLLFYGGKLFTFELKSTKDKSFSIQIGNEQGKKIKKHQIEKLKNSSEYNNVVSGFILDFRYGNTYFLHIDKFLYFLNNNNKKSINEKDVIKLNGIIIKKEKIRVNYKYDIFDLLNILI